MKQTTNKRPMGKRPGNPNSGEARPNSVPDAGSAPVPATAAPVPARKNPSPVPRLEPAAPAPAPVPRKLPMGQKSPPRPARPAGGVPRLTPGPLPKPQAPPAVRLQAAPAATLETGAPTVDSDRPLDAERGDPRADSPGGVSAWAEPSEAHVNEAEAASDDQPAPGGDTADGADITPPPVAAKTPKPSKGKKRPAREAKAGQRAMTTVPVRPYAGLTAAVETEAPAEGESDAPAEITPDTASPPESDAPAEITADTASPPESDAPAEITADTAPPPESDAPAEITADTASPPEPDASAEITADTAPQIDVGATRDDVSEPLADLTAPGAVTVSDPANTAGDTPSATTPILKPKAAPVPKLRPAEVAATAGGARAALPSHADHAAPAAVATKPAPGLPLTTKAADSAATTAPERAVRTPRSGNVATIISLVPVLALVVLLAVSTVAALTSIGAPAQVAASGWLADNVDRDQRLIVDQAMADDLRAAGWDGDDSLWAVPAGGAAPADAPASWRDADFVVATDAMRDGSGTSAQIASAIDNSVSVAAFGAGDDVVEIRQIMPEGAVLASVAETRAAATRARFGGELLQNPAVILSEADRSLLTAGRVDTRIISVLGALAAEGEVSVAGFPVIDGETGRPIRQVVISAMGDEPLVADGQRTPAASTLIDGLLGRFTPDDVAVRAGSIVLRYSLSVDSFLD